MKKQIPKRIDYAITECPVCKAPIKVKRLSDCERSFYAYMRIVKGYANEIVVECEECGNFGIVKEKEA